MKKNVILPVIGLFLLGMSNIVFAKEVTICSSYLVGASNKMECSGIKGKQSFDSLYKKGWSYVGDIAGVSNSFMLVFEK